MKRRIEPGCPHRRSEPLTFAQDNSRADFALQRVDHIADRVSDNPGQLGTAEWYVIHHINCGMELFTDEVIRSLLASSLTTSSYDGKTWKDSGKGPGSHQGDFIDWLTITDQARSVKIDVERIREHPLVPGHIPIYGYIYQVESGKLIEVPEATQVGQAR